jgi:hypothetical protein
VLSAGRTRPRTPNRTLRQEPDGNEGGRAADAESPLRLPALPAWLAGWAARGGTEVVHYRLDG